MAVLFKNQSLFAVIAKNRIIAIENLFSGSINCIMIHPREIIKKVLGHKALSIIIGHNHPSGDPEPSDEDYDVTKKIKLAMDVIEGNLFDHVIVGTDKYYSFQEQNKI